MLFRSLIECRVSVGAVRLKALAKRLLDGGCVALYVIGNRREARLLSAAFDMWVRRRRDTGVMRHTPYSQYEMGWKKETLEEALEWFVMPMGATDHNLVATIGDADGHSRLMSAFARVVGDRRERLSAGVLAEK